MNIGDRVKTKHKFLSEGTLKKKVPYVGWIVKLDEKAPNEYAWDTDEVLLFDGDIEVIEK